jgi:hypothetical protein
MSQPGSKRIINFPSDRNGCGFYRTIIPLGYLSAKLEWDVTFMYQFAFDLNLIRMSNVVRFQRQCTENQIVIVKEYKKAIVQTNSPAKLMYELDDLVHGIEPHNVLAYQFYTPTRRQNVVDIMKMCNTVTFSTQFLKDYYQQNFDIHQARVLPNMLPKFLWNPTWEDKRPNKSKPVVLYSGSASHFGPGGDMEPYINMIEATMDEFEWVFLGVIPPKFAVPGNQFELAAPYKDKIKFIQWVNFWEYPSLMQTVKADVAIAPIADTVFNLAKSDLKYKEYSAMNIPAICTSIGRGRGPYDLAKCKNLVPAQDPDAMYQAIKDMYKDENKRAETLAYQREYVNNWWLENPQNIELYNQIYS